MPYSKIYNGFSLIELLTVLAIIVVLGTVGILTFYQSTRDISLDNDLQLTIETLNKARQYAVDSKNKTPWGIHFNQNSLVLFSGSAFNPSNPNNITLNLSTHSTFSIISLSDGSNVVFNQLNGSASSYGYVVISLKNSPSDFKTIYIQASGIINISSLYPTPSI
jgi:prepilin-type N-terminal cleavage/methylation domain-containing protein